MRKRLTREGYLTASRGQGGGLTLAMPAAEIMVGSVIRKVEDHSGVVECMRPDGQCVIDGACWLAAMLSEAQNAFFDTLDRYSLADATARQQDIARFLKITHETAH